MPPEGAAPEPVGLLKTEERRTAATAGAETADEAEVVALSNGADELVSAKGDRSGAEADGSADRTDAVRSGEAGVEKRKKPTEARAVPAAKQARGIQIELFIKKIWCGVRPHQIDTELT